MLKAIAPSAEQGLGTVTSVSVTTANGVSGTVATATTTPAISLTVSNQLIVPRAAAGGTVDAITATYSPAVTLADQILVAVVSAGANATTTPTFAPNGLTARTITKGGGQALAAGDIGGAGFVALLEYNLANTRWELLNPVPSSGGGLSGFAYDAGTSNFAGGIIGLTTGTVSFGYDAIANASGGIHDFSLAADDTYVIGLDADGNPTYASVNISPYGIGNGSVVIGHVVVVSGAITTYTDLRTWAAISQVDKAVYNAMNGAQTAATTLPAWCKVATLTYVDFQNGTLSGANLISTLDAFTAVANSVFGGAMVDVTVAFDGPSLGTAALNVSGAAAALSSVNIKVTGKTLSYIPRTTLASGAISAVATTSVCTWPNMTAGSLALYVLLSKVL